MASSVKFSKFLALDSSKKSIMLSRAFLWSFCCSWYIGSPSVSAFSASPVRISSKNLLSTPIRAPAFLGPLSSNQRFSTFPGFKIHNQSSTRYFSSSSSSEQETLSVESLADKLANTKFSNIVVLVGAGASCSAGIPDFRTPGTGLYDKLGKYDLPMPEAIFDLDYYTKVTPMPFVDLCQDLWPGQEDGPRPTPTHHFLKLLEDKGLLHRIYTQNIDGLESLAGISTDKLVECHGHFRSASCTNCKTKMPIEDCRAIMVEEGKPPKCPECGSLVKPDIVFFGEEMPTRFMDLIDGDVAKCDLLLVFGTSLLVMPVAGIPSWVSQTVPRVLFNLEPAGGIGSGISKHLRQDLFVQGDCDASLRSLCKLAGWSNEFEALIENKN